MDFVRFKMAKLCGKFHLIHAGPDVLTSGLCWMANETLNSLLIVVLDCNPWLWAQPNTPISFTTLMDHLFAFFSSFTLLNRKNSITLLASLPNKCEFVNLEKDTLVSQTGDVSGLATQMKRSTHEIARMIEHEITHNPPTSKSNITGSLAVALCYANKVLQAPTLPGEKLEPRILVISIGQDEPMHYVPLMNSLFAAQKLRVVIDCCHLGQTESSFLKHATDITNGIYMQPQHPEALVQYLLTVFIVDPALRKDMPMPKLSMQDNRAACFCHNQLVDKGLVCSACLAVYCEPMSECPTCKATFWVDKTRTPLGTPKPSRPSSPKRWRPASPTRGNVSPTKLSESLLRAAAAATPPPPTPRARRLSFEDSSPSSKSKGAASTRSPSGK